MVETALGDDQHLLFATRGTHNLSILFVVVKQASHIVGIAVAQPFCQIVCHEHHGSVFVLPAANDFEVFALK